MLIEIHPKFRLNGNTYSKKKLQEVAEKIVGEGEDYEQAIGNFLLNWLDESATLKVNTSGSTGKPKAITLKKQHMINSALATGEFFNLQEGNTALLCLPADYIAGKMMLVRALVLGLELDYVKPTMHPLKNTDKSYDFSAMAPLQLENSFDKLEQVKTLIVGGAQISRNLERKVQDNTTAIFETYGMTETITHIAVRKVNHKTNVESSAVETSSVNSGSFKTLPNIMLSKDDRDCLIINAPKVSDNPVITNDIVNLVSKTQFEWLGRHDNVINSGGIKLFPEQIEKKLSVIINTRFFVAGIPDESLGQKLILIVEKEIDIEQLLQRIKDLPTIRKYEVPKKIYWFPKFKETESGKIQRIETINLITF